MSKSRSFERGSLLIGMGVVVALLSASLAGMGWLYNGALKEKARIEGEYEAFKDGVRRLGEEAEAKNAETLRQRERIANERIKSLGKRAADAIARADRMCKSAGLSAGCSALPKVPDTARPADDEARNQRLLAVLRHAQNTVDQLVELQQWVWMHQIRDGNAFCPSPCTIGPGACSCPLNAPTAVVSAQDLTESPTSAR